MKGLIVTALVVVSAAVAVVGVRVWLEAPQSDVDAPVPVAAVQAPDNREAPVEEPVYQQTADQTPEPELAREPVVPAEPEVEQWQPDPHAVESLRRSMEEGDPRAPPIARRETEREMPTEEELADPELYLQYESRQQQKVYASFIQASEKKISDLKAIIDRAKSEGSVSPEQLAEGEEKLHRLEEMRDKLLQENPELAAPETDDAASGQAE